MNKAYKYLFLLGTTLIVQTRGNHQNATERGCVDIDPKCALIQDVVDESQTTLAMDLCDMGASHYCPVSCFKNSTARNACCDYLDEGFTGNVDKSTGGITSLSDCMDYCAGSEFFGWTGEYHDSMRSIFYTCFCQNRWAPNKWRPAPALPGYVSGRVPTGDIKTCVMKLDTSCENDAAYFGNVVTFQDGVADLKTCQDWCASQNVWLFSYHETHNNDYPDLTQRCWCQTRLQPNKLNVIVGVITGSVKCEKV